MTNSEQIRVLIVDDHAMVHIGLAAMLDACETVILVGEANSAEEAFQCCAMLAIDVVLMDLMLPGIGGVEATRQIKQQYVHIQVLVLTSYEEVDYIHAALQAGAAGYLLKNITAQALQTAIERVHAGQRVLSPEVSKALLTAAQPLHELTERELEVLAYVVRGMSNTQIAEQLVVSPFTIKAHISNILTKLSVATRAEAAAYAVQHKLVRL